MFSINSLASGEAWTKAVRIELTRLGCDADQAEIPYHQLQELILEDGIQYDPEIAALDAALPPLPLEDGIETFHEPSHEIVSPSRERWFYVDTLYGAITGNARVSRGADKERYDEGYSILSTDGYEAYWQWKLAQEPESNGPWICLIEDCDSHECLLFTPDGAQDILSILAQLSDGVGGIATWTALGGAL